MLFELKDSINSSIIPFIVGTHKRTQVITHRLDSYWNKPNPNTMHRDSQMSINPWTTATKEELPTEKEPPKLPLNKRSAIKSRSQRPISKEQESTIYLKKILPDSPKEEHIIE